MRKEDVCIEFRKLFPNGDPQFYDIMIELCQLHNDKNADYATKENPLGNFMRVGELCKKYGLVTEGHEATKVAIIYMLKQLDAALKLLQNKQTGNIESIGTRLGDVAVYSTIIRLLYERGL